MLLTIMGSIEEGPQKMSHIWPCKSIEDRVNAREQARHRRRIGTAHLAAVGAFPPTAFSDLK